ncbi:hypothetical protein HYH02_011648 [Chlamydomonas schloesseri]|uniref:EF-hand domain-containing protein n=1 Tax=Chlamydomonas schloesseri TaxID=2026947 RepID=A0A835T334_9CHLO|nr:hypothetical protein HYH02_011648 [Chlamydomonas schloesseri]|eukprot:KAG2436142.1 hypothetical protein HYH02_011648 [Chlamydomonas schloesseri]
MAFLQRLGSGIRDGLNSLLGKDEGKRDVGNPSPPRTLAKISSRGNRPSSAAVGILETHTREAIAAYVQEKFDKGEAKPHVFTQFWLQFPKLEAGFEVLRRQLEARTGSRDGPLPLALLRSHASHFGLPENSAVVRNLCDKSAAHKCRDIDFVGLVMLLLVAHLTEPAATGASLPPDVRTMLGCLELAFTHFNSARRGKLDKREVAEALQYESAKAHTKEGRGGRTSNRLAHRLFEGLDWEYDNTISFENFLRGILQLVSDEFGDDDGQGGDDEVLLDTGGELADGAKRSGSVPTTPGGRAASGSGSAVAAGQAPGTPGKARSASASGLGGAAAPANVA